MIYSFTIFEKKVSVFNFSKSIIFFQIHPSAIIGKRYENVIVHELDPKKWVFSGGGWTKHNRFLVTLRCVVSRKVWWAVWMGSFWPKIKVCYRPEGTKAGTTWKWILSIFKFRNEYYKQLGQKKEMKKMGSFV